MSSTSAFRIDCEELEVSLPSDAFSPAFSDDETALATVAKLLCTHGGHHYETIQSGLSRAFREAHEKCLLYHSTMEILASIRTWALCSLGDSVHDALLYPLETTRIHKSATFPARTKACRSISDHQARGILANAFLGNILDPMAQKKDRWNMGGLDFREMLANSRAKESTEKMKCLIVYFDTWIDEDRCCKADSGRRTIEFERIRFKPMILKESIVTSNMEALLDTEGENDSKFVGDGVTLHENTMESSESASGFVNFANPNFCYGRFISSCTQEEILTVCCPEVTVGMIFIGKLADNEIVNIRNVRRYSLYSGYLKTFSCNGRLPQKNGSDCLQTIITMDACYTNHFLQKNIERDVSKAYYAFSEHANSFSGQTKPSMKSDVPVVSTGKWGCGMFGGLTSHKMIQQALAANMAGVRLDFSALGGLERCDEILGAMRDANASFRSIQELLLFCREGRSFVEDALTFLSKLDDDKREQHGVVAQIFRTASSLWGGTV
mmetsp:Transcript_12520/g.36968  ORF Transcript_12520/g.36968 Transcript_12520/m.36968 type:complete len:496 (-) Transcript_12520:78-1565(-)